MATCIVLSSGGISSTVAAALAAREREVHLLHVNFGQAAASSQRNAVREIAGSLDGGVVDVDLPHLEKIARMRRPSTPQHDQDANSTPTLTVASIPLLMTELLGIGVHVAVRVGAEAVIVGSSESANEIETGAAPGRGTAYHRRDYYYLFSRIVELTVGSKQPLKLETPLIDLARDEIIKVGTRFNTPFDLTYACQTASGSHCGVCADCLARERAFQDAGMLDPTASGASG